MSSELFVIDLSGCSNTGEIITNISAAFEVPDARERKIGLKLSDIVLNQAQMLSIQSLIASWASELDFVETANEATADIAQNMGIRVIVPPKNEKSNIETINIGFSGNNISDALGNGAIVQELGDGISFDIQNVEARELKGNGLPSDIDTNEIKPSDTYGNNVPLNPSDSSGNGISDLNGNGITPQDIGGNGFEEFKPIESAQPVQVETLDSQNTQQTEENDEDKQVMDTYKKAYDENEEDKQSWEEVDYYAPATDEPVVVDSKQTIYVNQTLRSGQVLEFDGNIVIIGDCHPGSEIKATGDITVWGVLGSIAHAGMKGNRDARIRALKMNAVQLRIADCYSRRPDGTNIPYIIKSSVFTPEEARITDDSIVLYKIIN